MMRPVERGLEAMLCFDRLSTNGYWKPSALRQELGEAAATRTGGDASGSITL